MKKKLIAELYRSKKNKKWYVRLKGRNGEIVWKTGDGYERIAGAKKAIKLLESIDVTGI